MRELPCSAYLSREFGVFLCDDREGGYDSTTIHGPPHEDVVELLGSAYSRFGPSKNHTPPPPHPPPPPPPPPPLLAFSLSHCYSLERALSHFRFFLPFSACPYFLSSFLKTQPGRCPPPAFLSCCWHELCFPLGNSLIPRTFLFEDARGSRFLLSSRRGASLCRHA